MRQRAELTFRQNQRHGRHGWLRLTPAYSVTLVDDILSEFAADRGSVLEPFSGTGTTPLCAANRGLDALAIDINPFLVWLARVKLTTYATATIEHALAFAAALGTDAVRDGAESGKAPAIRNIERWWDAALLAALVGLRHVVEGIAPGPSRDLLDVAFARVMIGCSNAAFDHPSMSFKPATPGTMDPRAARRALVEAFTRELAVICEAAAIAPAGRAEVRHGDARTLEGIGNAGFDLLVTSPPYPNRMSYIRELRPYMYWLGYLDDAKQAGELDWTAIGGTWGVATSRLAGWEGDGIDLPSRLSPILRDILRGHPTNGPIMARYVQKYFCDMGAHFRAVRDKIRPGGSVHYVVGNSSFYDHVVPTELVFCDQLTAAGFRKAEARVLRKRNSKRALFEYHVIATR